MYPGRLTDGAAGARRQFVGRINRPCVRSAGAGASSAAAADSRAGAGAGAGRLVVGGERSTDAR